jgi:glutathione S-transferase
MLHMFAMIFKCFSGVFASVSSVFFYMLQLSYLIVSKINQVLPMGFAWEAVGGADDIKAAWVTSGVAWVMSVMAQVAGALAREPYALGTRHSVAPCADIVQELVPGLDVRALANLNQVL